jgi:hypothetical protein
MWATDHHGCSQMCAILSSNARGLMVYTNDLDLGWMWPILRPDHREWSNLVVAKELKPHIYI